MNTRGYTDYMNMFACLFAMFATLAAASDHTYSVNHYFDICVPIRCLVGKPENKWQPFMCCRTFDAHIFMAASCKLS